MTNNQRQFIRTRPAQLTNQPVEPFQGYYAGGGVSELTAMKLGGWSDYRTMRTIYTHLAEKQEQADIEKLRNALAD